MHYSRGEGAQGWVGVATNEDGESQAVRNAGYALPVGYSLTVNIGGPFDLMSTGIGDEFHPSDCDKPNGDE